MSKKLETMTPELRAFIEEWKAKPGNLIMVLHRVQQTYGYIPREIAIETSEILGVPLAKIYGVITFRPGSTTSRCVSARRATCAAATTCSRSSRSSWAWA